jgi:hypothetical protein
MTEQEWNGCTDPEPMLRFLHARGPSAPRKLTLFTVACCRRVFSLLTDERSRRAVDLAERSADGAATPAELQAAWSDAQDAYEADRTAVRRAAKLAGTSAGPPPGDAAASAAAEAVAKASVGALPLYSRAGHVQYTRAFSQERGLQAHLLRDLFGPRPFRRVGADPAWLAWRGGAVVRLARAIYEERSLPSGHLDPARLAVLADMLEESGCADAELLAHPRSPGPHVRGCWVLDLLLERAMIGTGTAQPAET